MVLRLKRKTFRSVTLTFIAMLIIIPLVLQNYISCAAEEELGPKLTSKNAIAVYNIESGQMLYTNRGDEVVSPTVAAKLLATMVIYDIFKEKNINFDTQTVTVSAKSLNNIGKIGDKSAPRLGLTSGNIVTAKDLMNAALVANANDACSALAYYCATDLLGGEIEEFIERMNQKAVEIGTTSSLFKNVTGLDQLGMVTTPKDAALIAAAFYKYNDLLIISKQPSFIFNGKRTIHTKNYLLSDSLISDYKTTKAIGIIAGQRNDNDDYTLITAVEKEGLSYIIVVMKASGEIRDTEGVRSFTEGNAYEDIKTLIPWTLESFGYKTLSEESEIIYQLRVNLGKNYDYISIVPENKVERLVNKSIDVTKVERTITYDDKIVYKGEYNEQIVDMVNAPISKGQIVGKMVFSYNATEIASINLVAQSTVDSSGMLSTANKIKNVLFGNTMKVILVIFAVIVVAYILFSITTSIMRGVKRIKKHNISKKKETDSKNNLKD